MPEIYGSDAYSPEQVADRVDQVGVRKSNLPILNTFALGLLAGSFIGLGALFYLIVASDASLSPAIRSVLGGVVFSLGLILVVVAGAGLPFQSAILVAALVGVAAGSGVDRRAADDAGEES